MGLFDIFKRKGDARRSDEQSAPSPDSGEIPPIPEELRSLGIRTAWLPVVEEGNGEPGGSRIGGEAFVPEGEEVPECGFCGKPLQLVVQLRSSELPEEVAARTGEGIFQMFYCLSDCALDADGWAPYSKAHCARRLPLETKGALVPAAGGLPGSAIVGWSEEEDLPGWDECSPPVPEELESVYEHCGRPLDGDKLEGWPAWVQGVEYPSCKVCSREMRVLFQVDSEDHLDWMWGDAGCAHLSQCPEHLDELAFGWACG